MIEGQGGKCIRLAYFVEPLGGGFCSAIAKKIGAIAKTRTAIRAALHKDQLKGPSTDTFGR